VQPFGPGVEMLIELAVTAPVESAGPTAVAHLPTTRSLDEAVVRWVKVVDEVRVTTTLEVVDVLGFFSLTVTVEPVTPVTWPDAAPKFPPANRPPPDGRVPEPPPPSGPAPSGPAPPGPPPPGPPVPPCGEPPLPAPPNPPVHEPDVGWLMLTVVAVTGSPNALVLDDELDEVGLPKAETHEPTVTSDAVAVTVWSNVVDVV
jgi:hypothetical protein